MPDLVFLPISIAVLITLWYVALPLADTVMKACTHRGLTRRAQLAIGVCLICVVRILAFAVFLYVILTRDW